MFVKGEDVFYGLIIFAFLGVGFAHIAYWFWLGVCEIIIFIWR